MELIGLALLLVFALAVVIFFTRGVFARDLTNGLKRVNQQEQELQEQADILENRINQMERDYQAKLKRADAEAQRIVEEAKQQVVNIRTAAVEEAKYRARQLLLEAEQGRAQLKAELAHELNGKLIQRVCDSLRALLPAGELNALHEALVSELLRTITQLDAGPFKSDVAHVEVVTAQPLSCVHSQQLAQWVVASLGSSVPLHLSIDPTLVAGCVVRIGPTIVDSSLASRLSQR